MINRKKHWNIFARELENILIAHNLHLGLLDDRVGIHREKVRRLQQSLLAPNSFPVLSPEDMDLLIQRVHLNEEEWVRLRAAMLATAVERMLIGRIDQDNALLASEQIYTILRAGLQAQAGQKSGMGSIRGGDGDSIEDTTEDTIWIGIWNALDEANLALHMSYHIASHRERIKKTREAQSGFVEALAELDTLDNAWKTLQNWRLWHQEAHNGLTSARERLEDLGEE